VVCHHSARDSGLYLGATSVADNDLAGSAFRSTIAVRPLTHDKTSYNPPPEGFPASVELGRTAEALAKAGRGHYRISSKFATY
jgi:hypothetical protein